MRDFGGRAGAFALLVCLFSACSRDPAPTPSFRELVEQLSEEGAYFDTDNLISNETAYSQVVEDLEPMGGVYIGVGPEQNFHYIGKLRPSWAFIVDIRRDNMLHHLLLNALLVNAETPYAYLCWLFSLACEPLEGEDDFESVLAAVEGAAPDERLFEKNLKAIYGHIENRLEYDLDDEDARVVALVYRAYFDGQLGLRFRSHGRRPMRHHPTYRRLLVERGSSGETGHFLSRPDDYAHVRGLAGAGRLIPVVGDFAGDHALRKIGELVEEQGETVSAFYVSNVEFYLIRNEVFSQYVDNVRTLPLGEDSQFIRAYFSYGQPHPAGLPGHRSTLVRQKMTRFLELFDQGAFYNYWDVSVLDYER